MDLCQHVTRPAVFSGPNIQPPEYCEKPAQPGGSYCTEHLEEHQ